VRRALVLLLVLVAGCSGSSSGSHTQRLVYRVVDGAGIVTTSTVDIAPPYRARVLNRAADGSLIGGFAWDDRGLYSFAPGSVTQTAFVAPGFPGPFSGLSIALPVAERQHLVRRLGTSSVLGRACTRWLSESPLDGPPLSPAHGKDRTESCVGADGLILSERWALDGSVVRSRTVTSVGSGPSLEGNDLFSSAKVAPLSQNDSAYVVKRTTAPLLSRLLRVPAAGPPSGLTLDTASAVLLLNADRSGFDREGAVVTWTAPGRLVVLQVERDAPGYSKATVRGAAVGVGSLGAGHLEPVLSGLRVVVDTARGLRVTATANLPEDQLLGWLRTLKI
jgi:hypothetical protein